MGVYGSPDLYPNNKPRKENGLVKALKIIGVTLLSFVAILASIVCLGMGIAEKNIISSIMGIAIFCCRIQRKQSHIFRIFSRK